MKGEKFILYSRPDGRVTKDFERRKRVSYSCTLCKKQKVKCDLELPCGTCKNKKRPHLCQYEHGNALLQSPSPEEQKDITKPKLERVPSDQSNQKLTLYTEISSGTTNYLGPWHADIDATYKEPGVRIILDDFEKKKNQKVLDCMRPWQQYEKGSATTVYIDPFLSGIDDLLLQYLINIYWQFINPIESFLDPDNFWQNFDKYSTESNLDNNERSIFCAVVWLILAYASRSLPPSDWSTERLQSELSSGTLMITVDPSIQREARFVADPCEFFLHCAETCFSHCQLFKSVKDIDSLTLLMLYIAYLHDGSERNWPSWTLLGMANNAAQRLGLCQDPNSLTVTDSNNIDIEKTANQRRNLYCTLITMNSLFSVDLGQMPMVVRESLCGVRVDNDVMKSIHDGEFILGKYEIAKVLARALETSYPFYSSDDPRIWFQQDYLDAIEEMESKIDSLWKNLLGTKLALRDGPTGDSNTKLEIALKLERPPVSAKIYFQRYILDTLIHKARFVLFRPFLKYKGSANPNIAAFQVKCLSSARAMLENQFAINNNTDISGFNKFRWNYVFSHAFQAAVVLSLQKDFERSTWELRLIQGSAQLYYDIRRHAGCAAAKAHLVLSNLLGSNAVEVNQKTEDSPYYCITPDVVEDTLLWKPENLPSNIESLDYDFFASVLGSQRSC